MGPRMTGEYSYDRDENLEALEAEASHERRMDKQRHADAMYELAETGFDLDEDEDNEDKKETKMSKEKVKIIQIMPDPQGGGILGLGSDGVVYGSNFSTWQIYLPAKFKDEEGGDA